MVLKLYLKTGDWLFIKHPQGVRHFVTTFLINAKGQPLDDMISGKIRYHKEEPWADGAIKTIEIVAALEVPDAE